jgi:hypothetical protein
MNQVRDLLDALLPDAYLRIDRTPNRYPCFEVLYHSTLLSAPLALSDLLECTEKVHVLHLAIEPFGSIFRHHEQGGNLGGTGTGVAEALVSPSCRQLCTLDIELPSASSPCSRSSRASCCLRTL